jgi:hypothetical protein
VDGVTGGVLIPPARDANHFTGTFFGLLRGILPALVVLAGAVGGGPARPR